VIGSGWRSALSRRLVLAAAVAVIPVLAGCEATNNAPTLAFHPPTDTAATDVGALSIRNVFVLGAPLGHNLARGQSASLFLAMVNSGSPDTLVSITAPGTAASVTLPASVHVVFGHPVNLSGPQPQLVLTDLTRPLASGTTIKLVLTFQKAGTVTMLVPVMARATHYVTYAPPQPVVSVSPTPSPSSTGKHRRAHPASSLSPGVSPSPSPSTS
jgi:copper(I)-binding protein